MAEEEPLSTAPKDATGEKPLRVRRGRVDSVDLYEIKDTELDLLERGSPAAVYLNFSIFLLSVGFAALVALCTSTFRAELVRTVFVVVVVVGFLLGALLLILWCRGRRDVSEVIRDIRDRIPPEKAPLPPLKSTSGIPEDEQPQPTEPNA